MTFRCLVVYPDNTHVVKEWPGTPDEVFKLIQTEVDGFVEHVGLPGNVNMFLNEDGIALNQEPNFAASLLTRHVWRGMQFNIVGPAVFCGGQETRDENIQPLTDKWLAELVKHLEELQGELSAYPA